MNNHVSSTTGFTPTKLFVGRPGFNFEFPCASKGNPRVDEWLTEQKRLADLCRSHLKKKRRKESRTKNRKRKEAMYQIGDWVLVHHSGFKAWPCNTLDSPYFGPFLVTDVAGGSGSIKSHPYYGGLAEVGYPQLKHYNVLDNLYDWEENLQQRLEAAAEDLAADPILGGSSCMVQDEGKRRKMTGFQRHQKIVVLMDILKPSQTSMAE